MFGWWASRAHGGSFERGLGGPMMGCHTSRRVTPAQCAKRGSWLCGRASGVSSELVTSQRPCGASRIQPERSRLAAIPALNKAPAGLRGSLHPPMTDSHSEWISTRRPVNLLWHAPKLCSLVSQPEPQAVARQTSGGGCRTADESIFPCRIWLTAALRQPGRRAVRKRARVTRTGFRSRCRRGP
jgi:hypothetical protein